MAAPRVAPREAGADAGPPANEARAPLVDTHAHLNDKRFASDAAATLDRARAAGIVALVVVGYDLKSSEAAVRLAEREPYVWAAVGIHPHHATDVKGGTLDDLRALAQEPRVVALGECGLDYYRNLSPAAVQRSAFAAQLELASRCNLPVVIHSREAMPDTLRIVTEHQPAAGGVMHCFDGARADALRSVELGLYISCAGPVTYRRDATLADAIAAVPEDRLVVETDCPYLSPAGHRGERNEPAFVRVTAETVAAIRHVRFEDMALQTSRNARRLFRLPALGVPALDGDLTPAGVAA